MKIQTVQLPIRLATREDFVLSDNKRKLGRTYLLLNSVGKIECYTLTERTNTADVIDFLKADRCFVIADINDIDYDVEIKDVQPRFVKQEVEHKPNQKP